MNNYYNLLMARRINMIEQNLNEEYIRKFNLSIDSIKKKRKKKLKIKELDELKYIINDLQTIPKDEKFKEYILRHLKVFLIYGNVKLIEKNNIVLDLTTDKETAILYIEINKDYITSTLKGNDYKEETSYKKLDTDYYTTFKRIEKNIYKNRNTSLHIIDTNEEFHGFHNNIETVTKLISKHDNYTKDNITETISRKGFGENNYKEITNYYRQDGFIVRKYQKKYKNINIGNLLNYKEYQISEDYNKDNKYLNPIGYYKKFYSKLYNPFLRGKCNIKTLYK